MDYRFSDLIDIQRLQKLMYSFYEITGISNAIIDIDGNILCETGQQDICTKFHRICPETHYKCKLSELNKETAMLCKNCPVQGNSKVRLLLNEETVPNFMVNFPALSTRTRTASINQA